MAILLALFSLLTSCAKEDFVINTVRLEQSCIDDISSVRMVFDISLEDDYQAEVSDEYSLVWNTALYYENGRYVSDELIIPYPLDGGKLDYKVISPSGRYLESSVYLKDVESCLWVVEDELLMPKKNIKTQITMISKDKSTVMTSDEPVLIEEGVEKIKVEYEYQGIKYTYTLLI